MEESARIRRDRRGRFRCVHAGRNTDAPQAPPIVPIADNVVGWLGTTGILAALRRRAIEGGSYRVVVSLTRTVLWLLSLGIFDQAYGRRPLARPTSIATQSLIFSPRKHRVVSIRG